MFAENRKYLREIGAFSLPAVAERLLMVVIGMVSSIFVGRLGRSELAAVSVATTVLDILLALFTGLGLGATIHIARAAAEENGAEKVRVLTFHALTLGAATALILGGACFFAADGVLRAMFSGLEEETKAYAVRYLRLGLLAAVPQALDVAVSSALRGVKDAKTPFVFTALVNVMNILLCLLFIYGLDRGIDGAAWAYTISTAAGGAAKLILLASGRAKITLRRTYRPQWALCARILRVSVPSMLEQLLVKLAFLGMQMVTALIGDAALAGYQVANNMLKLIYAITGGIESADVTLTGSAIGEGDLTGARRYARCILIVGEALTAALAVILFVLAGPCTAIFTKDAEVLERARHILRIMCFTIPLTTAYQCTQGVLKTGGMNVSVVVFNTIGPWLIRIPLAYVAVKFWNMGIYGLILGFFSDYIFRAAGELWLFFREKWLYKKI